MVWVRWTPMSWLILIFLMNNGDNKKCPFAILSYFLCVDRWLSCRSGGKWIFTKTWSRMKFRKFHFWRYLYDWTMARYPFTNHLSSFEKFLHRQSVTWWHLERFSIRVLLTMCQRFSFWAWNKLGEVFCIWNVCWWINDARIWIFNLISLRYPIREPFNACSTNISSPHVQFSNRFLTIT